MTEAANKGLPYDMGNAGDLLKHGVLAEFVRWRLRAWPDRPIRFLDLFGGEPSAVASGESVRRVEALSDTALRTAQPDIGSGRYYGSGMTIRNLGGSIGDGRVSVFVADRCEDRRARLRDSGLSMLEDAFPSCRAADEYDAYEALEIVRQEAGADDLTLIDPFGDFLKKAEDVVPQLGEVAERSAVLLFALNLDPFNPVGRQFDALLEHHLNGAWIMTCPPIRKSSVKGENKYYADVVLASPFLTENRRGAAALRTRLDSLAGRMADALALSGRGREMLKPRTVGRPD